MCTWRAFGISAGQELQINQHADPQPSHPFDGRGRRVHRIRPADSICRQVSLMMPPILDYLFSVIAFFLFLFWYFLWPSISYDTHFRDGNYLGKDRRIRSRMKRPACGTAATASGWMFTFTVPEPQLPVLFRITKTNNPDSNNNNNIFFRFYRHCPNLYFITPEQHIQNYLEQQRPERKKNSPNNI